MQARPDALLTCQEKCRTEHEKHFLYPEELEARQLKTQTKPVFVANAVLQDQGGEHHQEADL